ncbi:sugar phosphate isomerase/epimerase family protein [Sphingomonas sp. MMS24-JH45]
MAAESKDYCDDLRARLDRFGIQPTELSTQSLQDSSLAYTPPTTPSSTASPRPRCGAILQKRQAWAVSQVKAAARATAHRARACHHLLGRARLALCCSCGPSAPPGWSRKRSRSSRGAGPHLDVFAEQGVACAFEVHPGQDLHHGAMLERFLDAVDHHPAARLLFDPSHSVLQQLDYLDFIDRYHDRISCFHVKDAEFTTGRSASTAGMRAGLTVPVASARPATGRSISPPSSASSRRWRRPGWRRWSGNARSSARMAHARGRPSSAITSSA